MEHPIGMVHAVGDRIEGGSLGTPDVLLAVAGVEVVVREAGQRPLPLRAGGGLHGGELEECFRVGADRADEGEQGSVEDRWIGAFGSVEWLRQES